MAKRETRNRQGAIGWLTFPENSKRFGPDTLSCGKIRICH